jgi:hypothetical protein
MLTLLGRIILNKNKEQKKKKWSMQKIIVEDHTLYSTFQIHCHRKRFTYFVVHFFLYMSCVFQTEKYLSFPIQTILNQNYTMSAIHFIHVKREPHLCC